VPKAAKAYVRYIDRTSKAMGKFAMYIVLGMIAILLHETISRTIFNYPRIWTVEVAQFTMAAYYFLGGAYCLLIGGHVRMDLFYGRWSAKKRAAVDAITFSVLLFYVILLLHGGISGLQYALKYGQVNFSSWAPPMAPIKIIMVIGIVLMLLQVVGQFFKDLAMARGKAIT